MISPLAHVLALLAAGQGIGTGFIVLIVVAVLLLLWATGLYNALVRRRNHVDESWGDIETELKRRHNLIPNLVETVKGYAAHEKDTLENVVQARNAAAAPHASPQAQAQDENLLSGALRQLFALSERYPDLKANQNFLELQQELTNTEDRVQRARRFYNANVRDLNTRIEVFPSNIVAGMFGFERRDYFEIEDEAERKVPEVKF
ncbi:MAG: LemA family protein [Planctomycetota bacterium]